MSTLLEMVYSACTQWLDDLYKSFPYPLEDEYDASTYYEQVLKDAIPIFLEYGFETHRARNDAITILRSLFYEFYLLHKQHAIYSLKSDSSIIQRLLSAQQTPQKTKEWYTESYDILSGHEFGAICVGGQGEKEIVFTKKCSPILEIHDTSIVFVTPQDGKLTAFKWGWRYEPIARSIFEKHYAEGVVNDTLGRVRHHTLPRLGASPDGLIVSGPRCGRLVELKCPITRQLDRKIPIRYYTQMQLQAEVCDVGAVDYFECCFTAVQKLDESHLTQVDLPYVGKLCVIGNSENIPTDYVYSPLFTATNEGIQNANNWKPVGNILEESCWFVRDSYTETVLRNKRWWEDIGFPAYEEFWNIVDEARIDGRYNKKIPLFIDDKTTGSVHESLDNEVVEDVKENDEAEYIDESYFVDESNHS